MATSSKSFPSLKVVGANGQISLVYWVISSFTVLGEGEEDVVCGFCPEEWFWLGVVVVEVLADGCFELLGGSEVWWRRSLWPASCSPSSGPCSATASASTKPPSRDKVQKPAKTKTA